MPGLAKRVRSAWRALRGLHPRDPVLADWLGGGAMTDAGESVTPDNARECPEVDACIGLNEDTIATVPLDLFERKSEAERERASGHPLHDLLHDRPNGWQTSADFRTMMEGYRETHGNAYARVIVGKAGFAQALEPVHPSQMRPFVPPTGGVAYRWTPPDSGARVLLAHEVLHLRDSPAKKGNLVEGQSAVERHREVIGRLLATGRYLSRYFANNATSKLQIGVPGDLTEDQREALRDQFVRLHGGANLWKPIITTTGLEVKAIGVTNVDSDITALREQDVAQVARVWDTPLFLIGETQKSTSWGTGIEQQSIGFVVYYMRSKFVRWEQALNRTLMSAETGKRFYFEFNIDALLRGDFKTRMEGYALMIQWGLAAPNEIRRLMNLPPVEGGDERLTPLNMVPATRIMDVLLKSPDRGTQLRELDDATRLLASIVAASKGKHLELAK